MAHDAFLSYSSKDKAVADAVCATLERDGVRCWIAPRDVLPGRNYGAALIDALNESRLIVLVYTAHSNVSPQVVREVERAVSKGIPILPFRTEDAPLSKEMEYLISSQHWLDAFSPPLERHLGELSEKVRALLGRPAGAAPGDGANPAASPTAGAPGRSRALVFLAVAVLALGGVLAAVLSARGERAGNPPGDPPLRARPAATTAALEDPSAPEDASARLNRERDELSARVAEHNARVSALNDAQLALATLGDAVDLFAKEQERLPARLEELLRTDAGRPYLERLPLDPWGRAFTYRADLAKKTYELASLGADGVEGTPDDLHWPPRGR